MAKWKCHVFCFSLDNTNTPCGLHYVVYTHEWLLSSLIPGTVKRHWRLWSWCSGETNWIIPRFTNGYLWVTVSNPYITAKWMGRYTTPPFSVFSPSCNGEKNATIYLISLSYLNRGHDKTILIMQNVNKEVLYCHYPLSLTGWQLTTYKIQNRPKSLKYGR